MCCTVDEIVIFIVILAIAISVIILLISIRNELYLVTFIALILIICLIVYLFMDSKCVCPVNETLYNWVVNLVWQKSSMEALGEAYVQPKYNNALYSCTTGTGASVRAYDKTNGSLIHTYGMLRMRGGIVLDNNNTYSTSTGTASTYSRVSATNNISGLYVWGVNLPSRQDPVRYGNLLLHNGKLYGGTYDGYIFAVDTNTRLITWSRLLSTQGIVSTAVIWNTYLLFGTIKGAIYKINMYDGATISSFQVTGITAPTASFIYGIQSSVTVNNNIAYFHTTMTTLNLIALNLSSMTTVWQTTPVTGKYSICSPVISNGVLYSPYSDILAAVSAVNGSVLWTLQLIAPSRTYGIPVLNNGVLVITTSNGYVLGINISQQQQVWSYRYIYTGTGNAINTMPIVLNDDNTKYAIACTNSVLMLNVERVSVE